MRLLLSEDEHELSNALVTVLKHNNYSVDAVYNGQDALDYLETGNYDGAILDIMMPKMDGLTVLKTIRLHGNPVPVLLLTAKSEIDDRVMGLDCGADDYLTKPFSMKELLARIRVAQRRLSYVQDQKDRSSVFTNGWLSIDLEAATVSSSGQPVHLTATEYRLLKLLALNVGKVLTYSAIIREIWGGNVETDIVSLRVHMATLRKKLGDIGKSEPLIQTHVGIGYRMNRY